MEFTVRKYDNEAAENISENYGGDVLQDAEVVDCEDLRLREHEHLSSYVGGAIYTGESGLVTYTILTEEANDFAAGGHERTPVILESDELQPWMRGASDEARMLLERHQTPSESIRCYPVSRGGEQSV